MNLKTDLLSGAGNTFHIVYKNADKFLSYPDASNKMKNVAQQICLKYKADGFIFLEKKENSTTEYFWYFYNNDGSVAEMCGNATRCVGYYIKSKLLSPLSSWCLQTTAGPIQIEFVENEEYKITMSPVLELRSQHGFFCDTGVPHLVLEYKGEDLFNNLETELKLESKKLREHIDFKPKGTNVTYVSIGKDKENVLAASYERGVEDFTAACGTGAMAVAYYNLKKHNCSETNVQMPGGLLKMNLNDLTKPTMTGPALQIGSYEYEISN